MLYCPKCEQTYEDGTQRFCLNEGERLLRVAASGKSPAPPSGIFANILSRENEEDGDKFTAVPRFAPKDKKGFSRPVFRPTGNSSFFKSEPELEAERQSPSSAFKSPFAESAKPEVETPLVPADEASSTAEKIADRRPIEETTSAENSILEVEPPARSENLDAVEFTSTDIDELELDEISLAETVDEAEPDETEIIEADFDANDVKIIEVDAVEADAVEIDSVEFAVGEAVDATTILLPETLFAQLVKNRYRLTETVSENVDGASYFAEDTLANNQKVLINAWKDANLEDFFANQIIAEERMSLAQINHPNILNVLDSGKMSDGRSFLVTEFVEGATLQDSLDAQGKLDALRIARIVRQAADALGEAHQNNVLHRNLTPASILLLTDENGAERVKLANFGAAQEKLNQENLPYKSPEQIEGKIANVASDNYALAVITYRMLTDQLPFTGASVGELLESQREALQMRPSEMRSDLSSLVDDILKKALAFNSADRYARARDFGDDLFSEIIIHAPLEIDEDEALDGEADEPLNIEAEDDNAAAANLFDDSSEPMTTTVTAIPVSEIHAPEIGETEPIEENSVKATEDLAWEKRSPAAPNAPARNGKAMALLGVALLIAGLIGVGYFLSTRPKQALTPPAITETAAPNVATNTDVPNAAVNTDAPPVAVNLNTALVPEEIESPPPARTISQPSGTVYFQNVKENLKGGKLKNFLGFSLYYPQDWKIEETESNFLDVSRKAPSGLPIEQMLVSFYGSQGTYKNDAEIFPSEVKKTDATLKKIIPNYKLVSEGAKTVNNGWQAYEVRFEGASKTAGGDSIKIWGKRLFIPTQRGGMKNGYVITMLATSLSDQVQSIDDLGVKGELARVLETFEPAQNY